MRCQWRAFLNLVPPRLRESVDILGKDQLQELRLRVGQPPELVLNRRSVWLRDITVKEDLHFSVNTASQYSPWASEGISRGYITAQGGHRIGLCGSVVNANDQCVGIGKIYSVCIRVARDFPNISKELSLLSGSVLLIGPPGSGKTTLLRDLIRSYSDADKGSVAVVDERGELFPHYRDEPCFPSGRRTDVLTGCLKKDGITMLLRSMSPAVIAVDEITAADDCYALLQAGWCGVRIYATAHATQLKDLDERPVYRPLIESGLFDHIVVLQRDKSWKIERSRV